MTTPDPARAVVSLTSAELLYLFSLSDEAASGTNRERLGLPMPEESADLVTAGAASLLLRGLATRDGDVLRLASETGLIGYVLTHAVVWTEIGLSASRGIGGTLLLTADSLTLVLMPRELSTFDTVFVNPDSSTGAFVQGVAAGFFAEGADRMLVVRSSNDDVERSAAVVLTSPDRWRLADSVPRPPEGELAEDALMDVDRDAALSAVGGIPW